MCIRDRVSSCLLGVKFSQAAVEMISGPDEDPPLVTFNSPRPYQVFKPGDWIHFTGKTRIAACYNAYFHIGYEFFITSRKPGELLPTTNNPQFCYDCGGASSRMMKECLWGGNSNCVRCFFNSLLGHDHLVRKNLETHTDSYGIYKKIDAKIYDSPCGSSWGHLCDWIFHIDNKGCMRWLGDWNYNYEYWDKNGPGGIQSYKNAYIGPCWNVGDVDFSKMSSRGYKYKILGNLFLPDIYSPGSTIYAYYNKWYKIPGGLEFSGPAWACVRSTGSHFWFNYIWSVTCQPIIIEATKYSAQGLIWTNNGSPKAFIDRNGNMYLEGTLHTSGAGNGKFRIKCGGSVVASIDSSGNLYIKGSYLSGSPQGQGFVVKSNGDLKAQIDCSGNLRLKGNLYQGVNVVWH